MSATPWADLSSAERLDAILLAVASMEDGRASAARIAMAIPNPMELPRSGNHGRGNAARQMSEATRVTPGITALRRRGLLRLVRRADGLSGSADVLTSDGRARVKELMA